MASLPEINVCFTCSKFKSSSECTSVVLELQGMSTATEERSSILQVICQLLRVQWSSLVQFDLINSNLPFCPTCLKITTEIIILREKLFQIETEIREKVKFLEESVVESTAEVQTHPFLKAFSPKTAEYNSFRNVFRKEVMQEHENKQLLQVKLEELGQGEFTQIYTPSLVQLKLSKNVFEIVDGAPITVEKVVVNEICDAWTDTSDLVYIDERQRFSVPGIDSDPDQPPVLKLEGDAYPEDFQLIPVLQDASDDTDDSDSDYGSPSKKSKTGSKNDATISRLMTNGKIKKLKKKTRAKSSPKKIPKLPSPKFKQESAKVSKLSLSDEEGSFDENEIEGGDSDGPGCLLKISGSDSSAESGDETDKAKKDADSAPEDKDEGLEASDDESKANPVSIAELCQKHSFKRKNSKGSKTEKEPNVVNLIQQEATFKAKDKSLWTSVPPHQQRRLRAYEILREGGGLVGAAQDTNLTPVQLFKLMLPPPIIETVVKYTNEYAAYCESSKESPEGKKSRWHPVTVDDVYAYIGILLNWGMDKKRNMSWREAWTKNEMYASPMISATMSRDRFSSIQNYMRFDDAVGRKSAKSLIETEGQNDSKYSYISQVFDPFVDSIQSHLRPYDTLVVDEMLVKFRGSAKFRVYMKTKPGKYGIKYWSVVDVETGYVLKISLYEGKVGAEVERELGKKVVLKLVEKYFNSGRAVTMDNFFTSKSLGQELMKHNMSMLGTLNRNKMDIIPEFVEGKGREIESSVFAFQGDFTMVSYVPRKNRTVLLLSTQHHSAEINAQNKHKPTMILDYNATKGGVDTADQMIANSTCQRSTGRWPMKVFQSLLDIAGLNAYVIHKIHRATDKDQPLLSRRHFLRALSEGLMQPLIVTRIERFPCHSIDLKKTISKIVGHDVTEVKRPVAAEGPPKRTVCHFCPKEKGRKRARRQCTVCRQQLCDECGTDIFFCPKCPFVQKDAKKNLTPTFNLVDHTEQK